MPHPHSDNQPKPALLKSLEDLPVFSLLTPLAEALAATPSAVLQAPPGAGKSTGVPLALLEEGWLSGQKIILLEPRRLAARATARRMAQVLGENIGETVGYQVRLDKKIGPKTRIEVITEGILTRRLQHDASLENAGLVIFDEFHERSLDADLALALCLEAQAALRPDLKILVMSATLDGDAVAALLGNAPLLTSRGRAYPVATRYAQKPLLGQMEKDVSRAILRALSQDEGSILVFLPGAFEIRKVQRLLAAADLPADVIIAPLYGNLTATEQDRAIAPCPGKRKVVLATSIAETSLTIEGIRVVIDCGLSRLPRFDPRSGMTRLETVAVSAAAADQRRGRAGRQSPGICYRLWSEAAGRALAPFANPEIMAADLTGLALELAIWGSDDPARLKWLTPPPKAHLDQAKDLLRELGAVDHAGRITGHGKALAELPLHPRLGHMVLRAARLGELARAAKLAALLTEKSIVKGNDQTDIHLSLQILEQISKGAKPAFAVDLGLADRILKSADQICRVAKTIAGAKPGATAEAHGADTTGLLTAFAYPDRIAQARKGSANEYLLANGRAAYLWPGDPLATNEYLAVADVDGHPARTRIFRAAALDKNDIESCFAGLIVEKSFVRWDGREAAVISRKQRRLGQIILKDSGYSATAEEMQAATLDGISSLGLTCLPWSENLRHFQKRVELLRTLMPENNWPDLSDKALTASPNIWLAPYLGSITRRAQFSRIDLEAALKAMLSWNQLQDLDRLAPTHIKVPSGSHIAVDYAAGEVPVLAVRLQEMFGAAQTPTLAGGRLPLLLHLLSPARRPVQVTRDLPNFWATTYAQVKADLKGRYPKHYWPDNPLEAEPTARAKPRIYK